MKKFTLNEIRAKIRDKILSYEVNGQRDFAHYQKNDVTQILKVIYRYFKKPKEINVLDFGCSAVVVKYLAKHVKKIVGVNVNKDYLKISYPAKNMELIVMDGENLDFEDQTFDFIYSTNVYEHLRDFSKCLDEQLRVLKDTGYCYARWEPIWSSQRGHHMHDDMARDWERHLKIKQTPYQNNGRFIDDWSHLLLSKDEMFEDLSAKTGSPELANMIVRYVYSSQDINRLFFEDFEKIIGQKKVHVNFWKKRSAPPSPEILKRLRARYVYRDFDTCSSDILMNKKLS